MIIMEHAGGKWEKVLMSLGVCVNEAGVMSVDMLSVCVWDGCIDCVVTFLVETLLPPVNMNSSCRRVK